MDIADEDIETTNLELVRLDASDLSITEEQHGLPPSGLYRDAGPWVVDARQRAESPGDLSELEAFHDRLATTLAGAIAEELAVERGRAEEDGWDGDLWLYELDTALGQVATRLGPAEPQDGLEAYVGAIGARTHDRLVRDWELVEALVAAWRGGRVQSREDIPAVLEDAARRLPALPLPDPACQRRGEAHALAACVVAALALGLDVGLARLVVDPRFAAGGVKTSDRPDWVPRRDGEPTDDWWQRREARWEAASAVIDAAEDLARGRADNHLPDEAASATSSDWANRERAGRIVARYWPAIQSVATELLLTGVVTRARVELAMKGATAAGRWER